jgi:hypothetical protein
MKPWRSIFALAPDCHTSTGHYRTLWQRHFYDGIRSVVERLVVPQGVDFDWARARSEEPARRRELRAATSAAVLEQIDAALDRDGVDAVISYCFSADVEPGLVAAVVARGVPWINFFCDSTHRFGEVSELARVVSLNWFPESSATEKYAALPAQWVCLPYALNPNCLPDCTADSSEGRAAFIGLPSVNRITQLGILELLGCPVEIRGHGWLGANDDPFYNPAPWLNRARRAVFQRGAGEKLLRRAVWPLVKRRASGPLDDADLFPYLRSCDVVLGLNQGRDETGRLDSYLKFRDIEFPGYGCCYLTQRNEDLAKIFEIGVEIAAFDSLRDAARQIRNLLDDPDRSQRIGRAGRARVLAEHTWRVRLGQLMKSL